MAATEKTVSLETAGLSTTGQERGVKPQETTASKQTLDLNLVSQAAGEFAMERATPPDSPTTLNRDERAKAANMNASFSQSDAELAIEKTIPANNPTLCDTSTEGRSRAQTPRKSGGSKSGSTVAPNLAPQPTAIERNEAKTATQLLENRQLMPPLAPHDFSWPTSPLGDGRLEGGSVTCDQERSCGMVPYSGGSVCGAPDYCVLAPRVSPSNALDCDPGPSGDHGRGALDCPDTILADSAGSGLDDPGTVVADSAGNALDCGGTASRGSGCRPSDCGEALLDCCPCVGLGRSIAMPEGLPPELVAIWQTLTDVQRQAVLRALESLGWRSG